MNQMNSIAPMHMAPFTPAGAPSWLPPLQRVSSSFWDGNNVKDRLKELKDTVKLAKAM